MNRHRIAWMLIAFVNVAYIAWGVAAAVMPDSLLGPGGQAILPAGYEGYSGASWSTLAAAPAAYMGVLYRLDGIYCALFGFMSAAIALTAFRRGETWAWWTLLAGNTLALASAMTYDKLVNAIGPFEMTEYIGLALIWAALAITVPRATGRPIQSAA